MLPEYTGTPPRSQVVAQDGRPFELSALSIASQDKSRAELLIKERPVCEPDVDRGRVNTDHHIADCREVHCALPDVTLEYQRAAADQHAHTTPAKPVHR